MKTKLFPIFLVLLMLFTNACGIEKDIDTSEKCDEVSEAEGALYQYTIEINEDFIVEAVETLCSQKLYTDRDVYDSGHMLMLPMRYGFATHNDKIVEAFRGCFLDFVDDTGKEKKYFDKKMAGLNQNHWLYLMSEYMVYCIDYGYELDNEIIDAVIRCMVAYNEKYTGNFGGEASYDSFQELMEGLLHGDGYIRADSMNNLLSDNDTFPLAIICDCLYVVDSLNYDTDAYEYLKWGGACAEDMMKEAVVWDDSDRWILQPGGWRDQWGCLYAGYDTVDEVVEGEYKVVDGIGCDTSHYRRLAPFVNSYSRVATDKEYAERIKNGLINQFLEVMLEVKTDDNEYYRIKNYVDGSNGVFRYEIEDGKIYGYGPYQMSTSLLDGWWSLLHDDRITEVYTDIYSKLRYETELPDVYVDPVTTRDRNPFYTSINNYKMMTYIASLGI